MSLADWTEGGAEFDDALIYRHHLWRARRAERIDRSRIDNGTLGVCMHNPSKAGAVPSDNDPTVRKVIGFAERWGFSRIDVVNLGDMIATVPKDFYAADELYRVSDICNARIREVTARANVMLVAWGRLDDRWARGRVSDVLELIDRPVVCIDITATGDPWHPLMAKYTTAPEPYEFGPS